MIERFDLPDKVGEGGSDGQRHNTELTQVMADGLDNWLNAAERDIIIATLKETGGVQSQAARLLGISERSLWHRVKKLAIRVERAVHD